MTNAIEIRGRRAQSMGNIVAYTMPVEHNPKGHVDAIAVEIEGIVRRNDQSDDGFLAADPRSSEIAI